MNTRSADILDADGTVASVVGDGWSVPLGTLGTTHQLIFKFLADGSGDTVTFTAGDRPPAMTADLGAMDVVLAASDCRYIVVESGRFEQNDGTIVITCTDTGTKLIVFAMPKAQGGGSGVA